MLRKEKCQRVLIRHSMAFQNDAFIRYLNGAVGEEMARTVLSALDEPPSVSVRRNPFKDRAVFGMSEPVPWSEYGMMLGKRPVFTLDPFFHAGCYYVQDSSSMFVGYMLRRILGDFCHGKGHAVRVLDLCAAPGGKTTDAAASLRQASGDAFLLVANEVIRARASVLAANVAVWGDPNVVVTSEDPSGFSSMDGYFDIILADVPCSGEGMFRKDENAVRQWSEENVAHCAARQRRILSDIWPALAENGILIYSTCTFNTYENDGNVTWAAENLGADVIFPDNIGEPVHRTGCGYCLLPGFVKGEGQYCAVLRKREGIHGACGNGALHRQTHGKQAGMSSRHRVRGGTDDVARHAAAVAENCFRTPVKVTAKGALIKAVPETVAGDAAFLESSLRVIASGCAVGTVKGGDLVPDADLALTIGLKDDAFPRAEVDADTALRFLRRESFALPEAEKGYVLICHGGAPLGFVKNLGSRCNNLHPAERRIRMNF